ncbi:hypothetical protein [Pseudomonas chlororaphis]|uniref:hypothetical protein n=1 Tax=Pseudomonas chlororaphis TaxID=587753 RepID=UPI000472CFA2|nr:hypothetical protein [Pseudomonas chlororaphis]
MTRSTTLFPIGALTFSPGVDRLVREGRLDPMPFLRRHIRGDWGDVDDILWQANNAAHKAGERLESLFVVTRDISLSVFTLADRSATHVALALEA